MFSGIVEEFGVVQRIEKKKNLYVLTLKAERISRGAKIGDSISVDGVCLTITKIKSKELTFDLMKETLDFTTLKVAKKGTFVNLERALKMSTRIGGHFVSGHIDGVGILEKIVTMPNYVEWQISLKDPLARYLAPKGSVAVDGVSMTIGWVKRNVFSIYLIPHTLQVTTFGKKKVKDKLNIETDILAKYILQEREWMKAFGKN